MASVGQEIGDPGAERIVFRRTAAETGGELVDVEVQYAPHSPRPPEHYHPMQEERFTVLSGTVAACIDGVERVYKAGEGYVIPAGARHWMHNTGETPASVRWETRPALDTERFLETAFGMIQDGLLQPGKRPPLVRIAPVLMRHRNEFRLTSPPPGVQAFMLPILTAVAGILGYRNTYDAKEFSTPDGKVS